MNDVTASPAVLTPTPDHRGLQCHLPQKHHFSDEIPEEMALNILSHIFPVVEDGILTAEALQVEIGKTLEEMTEADKEEFYRLCEGLPVRLADNTLVSRLAYNAYPAFVEEVITPMWSERRDLTLDEVMAWLEAKQLVQISSPSTIKC